MSSTFDRLKALESGSEHDERMRRPDPLNENDLQHDEIDSSAIGSWLDVLDKASLSPPTSRKRRFKRSHYFAVITLALVVGMVVLLKPQTAGEKPTIRLAEIPPGPRVEAPPAAAAPSEPVAAGPGAVMEAAGTSAVTSGPATLSSDQAAAEPKAGAAPAVPVVPAKDAAAEAARTHQAAEEEIRQSVQQWAAAWSHQDVAGYLASYAPEFELPDGMSRSDWEALRKSRMRKYQSIEVNLHDLKVQDTSADGANVQFSQDFIGDQYRELGTPKELRLKHIGGKWLIVSEKSL